MIGTRTTFSSGGNRMALNDLLDMTVTEAAIVAAAVGLPLSDYLSHALLGSADQLAHRDAERIG